MQSPGPAQGCHGIALSACSVLLTYHAANMHFSSSQMPFNHIPSAPLIAVVSFQNIGGDIGLWIPCQSSSIKQNHLKMHNLGSLQCKAFCNCCFCSKRRCVQNLPSGDSRLEAAMIGSTRTGNTGHSSSMRQPLPKSYSTMRRNRDS